MFDVGAGELLVIVIVAIVVIGPKELPMALRAAGRWIGKMRRMSAHFRSGVETMIREAEMQEMEEKWAERNKEIMASYPDGNFASPAADAPVDLLDGEMRPLAPPPTEAEADASAEAAIKRAGPPKKSATAEVEPSLPLDAPPAPPSQSPGAD